jgi:hypothetical protein
MKIQRKRYIIAQNAIKSIQRCYRKIREDRTIRKQAEKLKSAIHLFSQVNKVVKRH